MTKSNLPSNVVQTDDQLIAKALYMALKYQMALPARERWPIQEATMKAILLEDHPDWCLQHPEGVALDMWADWDAR